MLPSCLLAVYKGLLLEERNTCIREQILSFREVHTLFFRSNPLSEGRQSLPVRVISLKNVNHVLIHHSQPIFFIASKTGSSRIWYQEITNQRCH